MAESLLTKFLVFIEQLVQYIVVTVVAILPFYAVVKDTNCLRSQRNYRT